MKLIILIKLFNMKNEKNNIKCQYFKIYQYIKAIL